MMNRKKKRPEPEVEMPLKEAAARLGVSERSLKKAVAEGCPHAYRRTTRGHGAPRLMFPMKSVADWLMGRGVRMGKRKIPVAEVKAPPEAAMEPPPAPGPAGQPAPRLAKPSDMGYFASEERLKRAELVCFNHYAQAQREGNVALALAAFRSWSEARRQLRDAAMDRVTLERLTAKAMESARQALSDWCEPMRVFMDGMPRTLANRVNPTNPALAEKMLREWLQTQYLPRAAKPLQSNHENQINPKEASHREGADDRAQGNQRPQASPAQSAHPS